MFLKVFLVILLLLNSIFSCIVLVKTNRVKSGLVDVKLDIHRLSNDVSTVENRARMIYKELDRFNEMLACMVSLDKSIASVDASVGSLNENITASSSDLEFRLISIKRHVSSIEDGIDEIKTSLLRDKVNRSILEK